MAKCGWCMTNDHGAHLYGGTGWRCDCEQCARKGPDSPRAVQTYVRTSEVGEESDPPGLSRPRQSAVPPEAAVHVQQGPQDAPGGPAATSAHDPASGDDFNPFAEQEDDFDPFAEDDDEGW